MQTPDIPPAPVVVWTPPDAVLRKMHRETTEARVKLALRVDELSRTSGEETRDE